MEKKPFVNGVERNQQHPTTFHIPSASEIDAISPGVYVKVAVDGDPGERFWVMVDSVESDGSIKGRVNNDLLLTHQHGYQDTDAVIVQRENILDIFE